MLVRRIWQLQSGPTEGQQNTRVVMALMCVRPLQCQQRIVYGKIDRLHAASGNHQISNAGLVAAVTLLNRVSLSPHSGAK